ncbi:MAG: sigma-70 family RNA polymerase sigma factor [Thermomicrobiales bacterium]
MAENRGQRRFLRRRQRDVVPDEGRGARLWEEYHLRPTTSLREDIVVQYAPLVRYVIGRLALRLPTGMDHEDLLGYGTIGLIEAVDRFDPTRGVKFETYAIQRIRGSIIDQLRRMDPVTRGIRQKATQIERAMSAISMEQGRTPEDEEVADRLDMSLEEYHRVLRESNIYLVPLDGGPRGEDDVLLIDTIVDEDSPDPVEVSIDQGDDPATCRRRRSTGRTSLFALPFRTAHSKNESGARRDPESRSQPAPFASGAPVAKRPEPETESNAEAAGVST